MKIALVHDYLREYGGAERVVEAIHEIWPEAPLYTAFVDWQGMGEFGERFRKWDIRTSWVERNWLVKKLHSPLRFLTPLVWESFDLRGYDVVISSSGWYISRGVVTRPETLHISYIHHPPRNLYHYPTGRKPNALVSIYAGLINPFLRVYDFATAQRVDVFVANSEETKARIWKFYRREAEVVYPPVEIQKLKFKNQNYNSKFKNNNYFLSVGRLNYSKQVDLAIEACNELKLPLKIVGTGSEERYLKSIAGPTIEFLGSINDNELIKLYNGARALIFCALQEDFGIVPVEAMAAGVPVIALKQGGVIETVIEGKTGVFFDEPEVESLKTTLQKFLKPHHSNNTYYRSGMKTACIKQAQKFSKEIFTKKFRELVVEKYRIHSV